MESIFIKLKVYPLFVLRDNNYLSNDIMGLDNVNIRLIIGNM